MAQTINLCTEIKLGCESVGDSVHLKLTPEAAMYAACKDFVVGTILSYSKFLQSGKGCFCNDFLHCYEISYEDDQTEPPAMQLLPEHILRVCCVGCIDAHALDQGITQDTSTGVIAHLNGNCVESAAVVVSTDDDNDITVGSDGGAYLDVDSLPALDITDPNTETLTTETYQGKPIYQQLLEFIPTIVSGAPVVIGTIPDIEKVISMDGYVEDGTPQRYLLPYADPAIVTFNIAFFTAPGAGTDTEFNVDAGVSWAANLTGGATALIKYTKV